MTTKQENLLSEELRYVSLENIRVNPYQPRRHFADVELKELAESILAVGLIHPPVVRGTENPDKFELVSGERRFRASKLAGLLEIPVVIRRINHSFSAQAALIENIQRVDLNPLEIAKALRSLINEFNLSQDEVAQRVGKKRPTIANYLRLLSLPKSIQDSLNAVKITMGHAKAILSLDGFEKQLSFHDHILKKGMSVREAEAAVQRLNQKIKKKPQGNKSRDLYLEQLTEKLQYKLGTRVSIQGKGNRGSITLDYFSLDDLDRLLNVLGIPNN